ARSPGSSTGRTGAGIAGTSTPSHAHRPDSSSGSLSLEGRSHSRGDSPDERSAANRVAAVAIGRLPAPAAPRSTFPAGREDVLPVLARPPRVVARAAGPGLRPRG